MNPRSLSISALFLFFIFTTAQSQVVTWDNIQLNWQATGGMPGFINDYVGVNNYVFYSRPMGVSLNSVVLKQKNIL